jgi:hypothetical protein
MPGGGGGGTEQQHTSNNMSATGMAPLIGSGPAAVSERGWCVEGGGFGCVCVQRA